MFEVACLSSHAISLCVIGVCDFAPCLLPTDWTYLPVYLALSTLATLSSSDLCVSVPNLGL